MTVQHKYTNPTGRNVFRLRDFTNRPQHGFNLECSEPDGYAKLTDEEKLSISEFVDFLFGRRKKDDETEHDHFYMRDHDNRPTTTELETPAVAPARYAELDKEERFHIHELIGFLQKRRGAQ